MAVKRAQLGIVILAWCVLGIAFAWVVPPGEAPDEPAHLEYVDFIVDHGALPPPPANFDQLNYEAHQPPLDYAVTAAIAVAVAPAAGDISFQPNRGFSFDRAGSRAFTVEENERAGELRRLRALRLFWGLLLFGAVITACGRSLPSIAGAALFLFSPQFLFTNATVNNDASLAAASAWVFASSIRLIHSGSWKWSLVAIIAFAAALFSKGSALFLLAPLAVVFVVMMKERERVAASVCAIGTIVVVAMWGLMNLSRFGAFLPPVPPVASHGWGALVARPSWIASLWQSFWAKLGWLNTPLPLPLYVWFLLPTALVAAGLWKLRRDRAAGPLVVATLAGNLFLVLAYLARVDWQPQGRYLFPSLCALAFCASRALQSLPGRWSAVSIAGALTVAGSAAAWVAWVF